VALDDVTLGDVTRDDYLRRWSQSHGGVPPQGLVGGWLRVVYRCAGPFVTLGVPPNAITLAGPVLAALALWPAAAGGRWPLLAVVLVVLAGLVDSLDGAVAVLSDRVSRIGAVLDSACDRLADLCLIGALWLVGGGSGAGSGGWLTGACLAGAVLAVLHEQVRASARVNGMSEVGVVTVSERPTRVIVTAAFLLAAGLYPGAAAGWATAGAVAWAGLGAIGLVQLGVVVAHRLTGRE
jgi:phosphatidylglycerophosphate synthase